MAQGFTKFEVFCEKLYLDTFITLVYGKNALRAAAFLHCNTTRGYRLAATLSGGTGPSSLNTPMVQSDHPNDVPPKIYFFSIKHPSLVDFKYGCQFFFLLSPATGKCYCGQLEFTQLMDLTLFQGGIMSKCPENVHF